MGIGRSLQTLGEFLDECEKREVVSDVTFDTDSDSTMGSLTASIELLFRPSFEEEPFLSQLETDAGITEDGTLWLEFDAIDSILPTTEELELQPIDASFSDSGRIIVTVVASVNLNKTTGEPTSESDRRGRTGTDTADPATAVDDDADSSVVRDERDVPPFRDPELLAEVYESCDRFVDMAEALDMDVTGETVRRYMIEHEIHDPDSYNTTDAEDGRPDTTEEVSSATVLADGIGLPDGVTPDELVEAVKDANTIYDIKRRIGLDREETITVLRELDILDFVVGRIDRESEREISREGVIERLRAQSANQ